MVADRYGGGGLTATAGAVGSAVASVVASAVGAGVAVTGSGVGTAVGSGVGTAVGSAVAAAVGSGVGVGVASAVGVVLEAPAVAHQEYCLGAAATRAVNPAGPAPADMTFEFQWCWAIKKTTCTTL